MENKVLKVGVTGGIGSGKSYVCDLLRQKGYPVYACDEEAKRLMVEDTVLVSSLKALIGEDAYDEDGRLNKQSIATFLFSAAENARRINGIVHPRVKDDFLQWVRLQSSSVVFMESAILFESGFDAVVDTTLMIYAPLQVRLERVMRRDGISADMAMKRVEAQMADDEKLRLSDLMVVNDGVSDLDAQITEVVRYLANSIVDVDCPTEEGQGKHTPDTSATDEIMITKKY